MMVRRLRIVACAVAALLAAGCGGGGSTPSAPSAPAAAKTQSGTLSLTFGAQTGSTSATRKPAFVSSGAMSLSVNLNSGLATNYDVSASSTLCTTTNGTRTCAIALVAPVGSNTIDLTLYSGANSSGHPLSFGAATFTVTAGTPFSVTVGMNPAVSSLASFSYTTGGVFALGTPSTATVLLTFADASGTPITGSGNVPAFSEPILLTSSDPSITFSPVTLTTPGQQFTMTYNGSTSIAFPVTLTAKGSISSNTFASSTLPFSAPFNAPEGLAFDAAGDLFVANSGSNQVLQVPAAALVPGVPQPQSKLLVALGAPLTNPARIAFDPRSQFASNFWVGSLGPAMSPDTSNVTEFNATTGAPLTTISGATVNQPLGLAVDNGGNLYVGNNNISASVNNVTVYTQTNSTPPYQQSSVVAGYAAASCAAGSYQNVNAMTFFGSANSIEVTTGPNVITSSAGAFSVGAPTCIAKANLTITLATAVAAASVNGVQTLYVGDGGSNTLSSFTLLSPASPLNQITLPAAPQGLAVDASGNIYVSIPTANEILEYNSSFSLINTIK